MKVLVVGGTLFNGLALVHQLVAEGHDVTILNRGKTEAVLPPGVKRLFADRTDGEAMRSALGNTEFDCVQDMSAYHPEDVEMMIELLTDRVGHYIFASSTVIYAASDLLPITESHPVERDGNQIEYGLHKILCEDRLFEANRDRGFPASVAAFSMVFGPHNGIPDREQRMFTRLAQGRPVLIPGDGTTLGQVCHVDDQARALSAMMGRADTIGKRYNLTGADYFTSEGYVDTIAAAMGVDARKVFIPSDVMDDLWDGRLQIEAGRATKVAIDVRSSDTAASERAAMGLRFKLAQLVQRLAPNIHRWNANVCFSIDRLRVDTGWSPALDFPAAVEDTYRWYEDSAVSASADFDFAFEDDLVQLVG
ncbi:MAG: NAD-dependent epimerase/dehydratase family protein [Acidimicrobiales bacterium]